ncbi:MAG: DUF3078 domain-containing protein [Saprospiraceae bacterium]|nr:DUF3078 domain-containing protein [Saprospiraceae bacterium]
MRVFIYPVLLVLLVCSNLSAQAGDDRLKEINTMAKKDSMGWNKGGGLGLDMAGMGFLNPKVGAGGNRFGLGGLGTFFANYKADKVFWNNGISLQLSTQRLGKTSPTQKTGFQKNLDILRLTSRYGYKLGSDKWYIAADVFAQTLLLKTYASNYLSPIDANDKVVAKFFAPIQITFSPGIDYKPNAHLSLFYSPCGIQTIYVADDSIAARGIHGNEVTRAADGSITSYKKSFFGLGSEFKASYNNKYYKDRLSVTTGLRLFSNYLDHPENVDVLFTNNFSIMIFKGLSLDLLGEYFYDNDVLVQKDVNQDGIYEVKVNSDGTTTGPDRIGRGGQLTGAFLLKFSKIF